MNDGLGGDVLPVTQDSVQTMATSSLFDGLIKGQLYRFTYRVKNINGWSSLADILQIRTAVAPSKPEPPKLTEAT
jgi:hypothetical protein